MFGRSLNRNALAICLAFLTIAVLGTPKAEAGPARAARGVIERLIGERADDFRFETIDSEDGHDVYELEARRGRVTVKGSSGVAMSRGAYEYLKKYCGVHVSWEGNQLELPAVFPDAAPSRVVSPQRYIHYFNACTFGYTMVWWDWERWEREIDWMALHGINMPLAMNGQEAVWQRVWQSYGLSNDDLADFFSGPAFLPWHRMGNLNAHAGPLPQAWIDRDRELQHKILKRERELGMTPVLQAFAGFVPPAFAEMHPELDIQKSSGWCGFEPTLLLNPAEPKFVEIGKRFVEAMIDEYGTDHFYLADTFIEMEPMFDEATRLEDFARIGEATYQGIAQADPQGTWILMGWPFLVHKQIWGEDEIEAMFSRVPLERTIILDLAIEAVPIWQLRKAFRERQWISSIIHNYGQMTLTYGILPFAAGAQSAILDNPERGHHVGAGITPEGIEQNAVVYELETDAIWERSAIELDAWLPEYCRQRYGACPEAMEQAWKIFGETIYGIDMSEENNASHYNIIPCMMMLPNLAYDPASQEIIQPSRLLQAIDLFLACESELGSSDLYRRDLIDLVKVYIIHGDRALLGQIRAADAAGDIHRRDAFIDQFLQMIDDLDRLVATRPEYHLSQWLNAARSCAYDGEKSFFKDEESDAEKNADLYEANARRLITRWGDHGNLTDYAKKEWSGLLNGYYGVRWGIYFDRLCLAGNINHLDQAAVIKEIEAWEESWVLSTMPVAEHAVGDEIVVARELLARYRNRNQPVEEVDVTAVLKETGVGEALYRKPAGVESRWASFENQSAAKGEGGKANAGAKGHAFDDIKAGETKTLLNADGPGVIHRMWMTIRPLDAKTMRSLKLAMYWDHAATPAVSVPLGDFFGATAGRLVPFENALFSSPEGRSFVSVVPMPYRTGARVTLTNESEQDLTYIFYDIDFTQGQSHPADMMYFHTVWNRERWTTLKQDFEILPRVEGAGRFLGCNLGVLVKPGHTGWWGEGEVKVYLDGDRDWPTLAGTGLEDYVGTGWGMWAFTNRYQGCPVLSHEEGYYSFYRYHVPDPVYFDRDCRVTIQQIGGGGEAEVAAMLEKGLNISPITIDGGGPDQFMRLLEMENPPKLGDPNFPKGWVNYYREDDYCATALFYLDRPENGLPALAPLDERLAGIEE